MPESTRRYVRENREDLEYILKHGSSLEFRAYAGALLICGLSDPEVDKVIDELQTGREAAGISDSLVRIAVDIEHVDDLLPDLDRTRENP